MLEIDCSLGEGGGQCLRSSIALASLMHRKISVKNIRGKRPKPGLKPQHLKSLEAIAEITKAEVSGLELYSREITFKSKGINSFEGKIDIGTAGSVSILLSQLLPIALIEKIQLEVIGGSDVAWSPPFSFLDEMLFPVLNQMGCNFSLELKRRGYYPKGNCLVSFNSEKAKLPLEGIKLKETGELKFIKIISHSSSLPEHVSERQLNSCKSILENRYFRNKKNEKIDFIESIESQPERKDSVGSGIECYAFYDKCILSGNSLGERGKPAELVGREAAMHLLEQMETKQPADLYLTDQLIPFMALAEGESEIYCSKLTQHALTNISVTEKLLGVKFEVKGKLNENAEIKVKGIGFN